MSYLLMIITFSIFAFMANMADAYDYYGAFVSDKDAPSSYMKYGIHGYHPVVSDVLFNSPASRSGLRQGDIILLINNKGIKRTSELSTVTANIISLTVFVELDVKP